MFMLGLGFRAGFRVGGLGTLKILVVSKSRAIPIGSCRT